MLAKVISEANVGFDSVAVMVEVDIASSSLPSFSIVGLADRAVEESKERVRSAIKNSGADFPSRRITVNLAPADLPKEGPAFDLSIALGLLIASGQLANNLSDTLVIGELSLDGGLRPTKGVLASVILAKKLGFKRVFIPNSNSAEAQLVEGVKVFGFSNLQEIIKFLQGSLELLPLPKVDFSPDGTFSFDYDFKDIKGQEHARRALEIAAAGGHNVLLKGPPGSGKTLLARTFPSILPALSEDEALELTKLYSISGNLSSDNPIVKIRPFRSPHHSASYVGIIGGGGNIKPGEVSLAHRGVLFLDEIPEFSRQVLEALRQPLEDRMVTISRSSGTLTFPAKFMLIAAQNPCPCGFYGSINKTCVCMPQQIARYHKKLSGPLMDRIDIHLDIPAVEIDKLVKDLEYEDSTTIRSRVQQARMVQKTRFAGYSILTNSEMNNVQIKKFCQLGEEGLSLLKNAMLSLNLSARTYVRMLKLSRTIADLAGEDNILTEHVAESLTCRMIDKT